MVKNSFFGRDNISFKTINMKNKQCFNNICKYFKLKKIINITSLPLFIITINS